MKTMRNACVPLLFAGLSLLLVACGPSESHAEEPPHWAYEGEAGPEHWGELGEDYALCANGAQQSPIDLDSASEQDLANITFSYVPSAVTILNNGHTIQVNYDAGSSISVDGHEYSLVQFHFHAPSEHLLDGKQYPAELHLVHRDEDGALAVVGVLLDSGVENLALDPVWANLPKEEVEAITTDDTVDANSFLPTDQTTYRYSGSLTTPPCSEGVSWFVFATPVQLSPAQLDQFLAIYDGNARPPQELGDRTLVEDSTP